MNRNTKITLIILGAALIFCLFAAGGLFLALQAAGNAISQSIKTDPTEAAAVGARIADYDVPEGFEQGAMSFMGIDMVFIAPAGATTAGNTIIMMMQFPESMALDQKQMEQQMKQSLEQQFGQRGFTVTSVETKTMTIRGQEVTAAISEGTDDTGASFRQMIAAFEGNNGTAMLMIMGSIEEWDQTMVNDFIKSMR